mmetsp:Transcript_19105/g.46892  ORF Transcript_19105/g.46892 Transcript_19105/m.46892 type:complete len:411 (-) Transcript_19105:228-1460(-)|eukprot:CAMPEP_0114501324 /NCGR_PEP_ID=MMETSP0109-20121206/8436_1 /TAXON_ID=29199 /ORGANISM="Chlorarachnion reptans, Strain CCCM449" /LENGTH=410 /DNA_ID=CAMNT_0001679043 /DNA_START=118 /DNA_END=1350 /DNA_ORIENTATION=-
MSNSQPSKNERKKGPRSGGSITRKKANRTKSEVTVVLTPPDRKLDDPILDDIIMPGVGGSGTVIISENVGAPANGAPKPYPVLLVDELVDKVDKRETDYWISLLDEYHSMAGELAGFRELVTTLTEATPVGAGGLDRSVGKMFRPWIPVNIASAIDNSLVGHQSGNHPPLLDHEQMAVEYQSVMVQQFAHFLTCRLDRATAILKVRRTETENYIKRRLADTAFTLAIEMCKLADADPSHMRFEDCLGVVVELFDQAKLRGAGNGTTILTPDLVASTVGGNAYRKWLHTHEPYGEEESLDKVQRELLTSSDTPRGSVHADTESSVEYDDQKVFRPIPKHPKGKRKGRVLSEGSNKRVLSEGSNKTAAGMPDPSTSPTQGKRKRRRRRNKSKRRRKVSDRLSAASSGKEPKC